MIYDFAVGGAVGRDVVQQATQMKELIGKDVKLDVEKATCGISFIPSTPAPLSLPSLCYI